MRRFHRAAFVVAGNVCVNHELVPSMWLRDALDDGAFVRGHCVPWAASGHKRRNDWRAVAVDTAALAAPAAPGHAIAAFGVDPVADVAYTAGGDGSLVAWNFKSGAVLWTGAADDEQTALDAMAREAGYRDFSSLPDAIRADGIEAAKLDLIS